MQMTSTDTDNVIFSLTVNYEYFSVKSRLILSAKVILVKKIEAFSICGMFVKVSAKYFAQISLVPQLLLKTGAKYLVDILCYLLAR